MSDETKKEIEETVEVLKQLDRNSLLLIKNGAVLLKARLDLEEYEMSPA